MLPIACVINFTMLPPQIHMLCCPLAQHSRIFLERGVGCHGNKHKQSEAIVAGHKKVNSTLLCCFCPVVIYLLYSKISDLLYSCAAQIQQVWDGSAARQTRRWESVSLQYYSGCLDWDTDPAGQSHLWWKIKSGQDLHWYDNDVMYTYHIIWVLLVYALWHTSSYHRMHVLFCKWQLR